MTGAPGWYRIEHVFPTGCRTIQRSLFGTSTPEFDGDFRESVRIDLDGTTWVEFVPGWLQGSDVVFDELVATLPLRQRTGIAMYDRLVDEPRLSAWWGVECGRAEPTPLLHDMRLALASGTWNRSTRSGSISTATVTTPSPGTATAIATS